MQKAKNKNKWSGGTIKEEVKRSLKKKKIVRMSKAERVKDNDEQ
jgi:hypothetical protein